MQNNIRIYAQQTSLFGGDKSMSSAGDFPASLSPLPENDVEQMMTVTSGRRCLRSYGLSDRLGLLVRMCLESPVWYCRVRSLTWTAKPLMALRVSRLKGSDMSSTPSAKNLNRKDIPSNRLLFRLAVSVRRIAATESGSLRDFVTTGHLLPTPVASDATMGGIIGAEDTYVITESGMPRKITKNGADGSVGLARLMKIWELLPTPVASDGHRGACVVTDNRRKNAKGISYGVSLADLAKSGLLPTPVASDMNGGSTRKDPKRQFNNILHDHIHGLAQQKDRSLIGHSSQLNPRFTLEMMGFPVSWLDSPFQTANGEPNR